MEVEIIFFFKKSRSGEKTQAMGRALGGSGSAVKPGQRGRSGGCRRGDVETAARERGVWSVTAGGAG